MVILFSLLLPYFLTTCKSSPNSKLRLVLVCETTRNDRVPLGNIYWHETERKLIYWDNFSSRQHTYSVNIRLLLIPKIAALVLSGWFGGKNDWMGKFDTKKAFHLSIFPLRASPAGWECKKWKKLAPRENSRIEWNYCHHQYFDSFLADKQLYLTPGLKLQEFTPGARRNVIGVYGRIEAMCWVKT